MFQWSWIDEVLCVYVYMFILMPGHHEMYLIEQMAEPRSANFG